MKRFTETGKWEDPWFAALPFKAKLAWDYILSKCNNAGVWAPNPQLADFQIGTKVDWVEFRKLAGDRIKTIRGEKWWIPSFVKFQYGKLSPDARVHQAIMKTLESHGLVEAYNKWYSDGIAIPCQSHPDGIAIPQGEGERQGEGEGPSGAPAATQGAARPRNFVLDALAAVDGSDPMQITKPQWGAVVRALADIRDVCPDVTATEINRRAENYRQQMPGARITPSALAKHWGACGTRKQGGSGEQIRVAFAEDPAA